MHGHRVCHLLASENIDVNEVDADGKTILHILSERGFSKAIPVLIERHAPLEARTVEGYTPIIAAAINLKLGSFNKLLAFGANVNAVDKKGRSVLHFCAGRDYLLQAIRKAGPNVDVKDENGRTAMHYWALLGNESAFSFLRSMGADPNSIDNEGNTPIHLACEAMNISAQKALITVRVNINLTNQAGFTVFHILAKGSKIREVRRDTSTVYEISDYEELLRILLQYDSSGVNIRDSNGKTAFDIAESEGQFYLARLIRAHGGMSGDKINSDLAVSVAPDNQVNG